VLVAPAYPSESTLPQRSSTPSHTYDAATLSKTRVWGSNEKILLHFRAVPLVSGKQHWGSAKCSCKNVVGSVVTYDYDAYGNLIHSTGTTPNNCLFAGEQFDPDLGLYYNRARYLNTSTGRFWSMDSFLTIQRHCTNICTRITTRLREAILLVISARRPV
jgi:RHS repeat-associated protein